jgi:LL-diaminopimelate aminotransferase
MIRINENFNALAGSYLFYETSKRVKEYQQKNPGAKIIRLGIGDVTEPLSPAIIDGLKGAVSEMGVRETFQGYPPYEGYEFLRKIISETDFKNRGIDISPGEIFISTGAKEDTANIQEIFSSDIKLAITDPVYPVYVDSNIMAGRNKIEYMPCKAENNFLPGLPSEDADLIYLCFPNNPTGQAIDSAGLKKWVDYARRKKAVILFDAAYEAYIREDGIPHSIYEIEGAAEVAVEFRSLSKGAGFTGTRCAYTVIPEKLKVPDKSGEMHSLGKLWLRRQSTKSNGVAYIIQKGAYEYFTEKGRMENRKIVDYYLENAAIIGKGIAALGLKYCGGINSPYIWCSVPEGLNSWQFFDELLDRCNIAGTPGSGFGSCGEGYFRLTGFGKRQDIDEAVERLLKFK